MYSSNFFCSSSIFCCSSFFDSSSSFVFCYSKKANTAESTSGFDSGAGGVQAGVVVSLGFSGIGSDTGGFTTTGGGYSGKSGSCIVVVSGRGSSGWS